MRTERADLDGLLAIVALAFLAAAAGLPGVAAGAGIDVAFVLVGWLTANHAARALPLALSAATLARRVLPALILVLAATLAAGWVLISPPAFRALAGSAAAAAVFVSDLWFWRVPSAPETSPLFQTWAVSSAVQASVALGLLLALLRGRTARLRIVVVAALTLGSFLLALAAARAIPGAAFFLLPARAWEFGLGALAALIAPRARIGRPIREAVAVIGILHVLAALLWAGIALRTPALAAMPAVVGAVALIRSGDAGPTLTGSLLSLRPLAWLGRLAYPLFLWSWPILAFVRIALGVDIIPAPAAVLGAACALAVAAATARAFRANDQPPTRRALAFGLVSMAVAALAGGAIWQARGLPGRFDAPTLAAFAAETDYVDDPNRRLCLDRTPDEGFCRFDAAGVTTEDGPADYLLLGDTMALAVMPAALAASDGATGMLAARSNCAPLLGVDRGDQPPRNGCAVYHSALVDFLAARFDLPLVILTGRWALNAEGSRPRGEAGARAWLRTPEIAAQVEGEANFAQFRSAAEAMIAAIRATGREVAILGSLPETAFDVPGVVARHLSPGLPLRTAPTPAAVFARQGRSDDALATLATQHGAVFRSLATAVCAPRCRVEIDGAPLYRDNHHLSRAGALLIAEPVLAEVFAQE